jgi:hypothetical protein
VQQGQSHERVWRELSRRGGIGDGDGEEMEATASYKESYYLLLTGEYQMLAAGFRFYGRR